MAVLDVPKFVGRLGREYPGLLVSYCDFLRNGDSRKGDSCKGLQDFFEQNGEIQKIAGECVAYRVDSALVKSRKGCYQYFEVAEFIKDAYGCPYVPGSSVKGMLRTAVLTHMILANRSVYLPLFDKRATRDFGEEGRADHAIDRRAFWREHPDPTDQNAVNDIMRYVSVSDSKPLRSSDLVFVKKYDKFSKLDNAEHKMDFGRGRTNREGNELGLYRECLKPGVHVEFTVDIDDRIDVYLAPLKLDFTGLQAVMRESFDLYSRSFLEHFDLGTSSGPQGETPVSDGRCRYAIALGPMAGSRCRNGAVGDSGYCRQHQNSTSVNGDSCTVYLGGGVDFDSKTVVNALIENEDNRLDAIAEILYSQFPTKLGRKRDAQLWRDVEEAGFVPQEMRPIGKQHKNDHRHWRDPEFKVSPHTVKLGKLGDKTYPMGKCAIRIEEL